MVYHMQAVAIRSSLTTAAGAFKVADRDGNERLSYDEYAALPENMGTDAAALRAAFAAADHDSSGFVERDELLRRLEDALENL